MSANIFCMWMYSASFSQYGVRMKDPTWPCVILISEVNIELRFMQPNA